jgi:hypothetical protein
MGRQIGQPFEAGWRFMPTAIGCNSRFQMNLPVAAYAAFSASRSRFQRKRSEPDHWFSRML